MRTALIQMTSGEDPAQNLATLRENLHEAKAGNADFALSPEVTNCISPSRRHQRAVLHRQEDDPTLAGAREEAARHGLWVLLGSLALLTEDEDGRFANRSFLIDPEGQIAAQYDKIHMFDVDVSETETYRESTHFRPGNAAITAKTDFGTLGLTICYDLRFAYLHRALAQAGADILTVPAAFSPVTGKAHWEALLRARAIETGCFVLAPAQTGVHYEKDGKQRRTYGHSLAVAPWGEVLVDAGTEPGVFFADLDLDQIEKARSRVPALSHDRDFKGPL
ncbi:carbon-nitrogen hydrolase family protein [Aquicoccus sp. G2-2]|uniref:carbon-nitrogen hydrolase family protein n=1 Tax=Aquicoccus sp. G2-2 TaxID=3092120 RepID=UPI002AE00C1C|nr:carbon-nitrogen hydrolase family protein [Aquicoccus sp. G2-2]MEA1114575.1 carbon-nitrogen hydrolase family protein [Aquicoccus sp. G2-2]